MDADLCLRDNLILFICFAKTSNFQSKFATTNSNSKKKLFRHALLYHVHIYKFPANSGLVDQSKPCTQIYLQIIATCINLQLPIVILKKMII